MAPHALLAARAQDDDLLGVGFDMDEEMKSPFASFGTSPMGNDHGPPKLGGYIIAGTVVSVCLAFCLIIGIIVALWICCTKARVPNARLPRRIFGRRSRAPVGSGQGQPNEESATPAVPLATLPAARIAGRRPPKYTAAQRPGFFSGMEVTRPLQAPFLDTVVEATSSEERVCEEARHDHHEDADDELGEAVSVSEYSGTDADDEPREDVSVSEYSGEGADDELREDVSVSVYSEEEEAGDDSGEGAGGDLEEVKPPTDW